MIRRAVTLILASLVVIGASSAIALTPRTAHVQEPFHVVNEYEQRLVIKFRDEVRGRARADGWLESRVGHDLSAVAAVAQADGLTFDSLIRLPENELAALEQRAAVSSGRAQADLAGFLIVYVPNATKQDLVRVGERLAALPEIEVAYLETIGVPPPTDLPPTTSDYVASQGHLGASGGLNSNYAWTWGATGSGVRISDCEYGWQPTHEDLNEISLNPEPGQTPAAFVFTNGWEQHGAAVSGVSMGMVNDYGINGMAPDAEFHTYPEWTVEEGARRVTCITNAIANSSAGDVVLLEMQTIGPGGDYGPAEIDLGVWNATKTGTDAGVIVVSPAGNGSQDLDSSPYVPYMLRGDSGALMVGAGSANANHNKLNFSTHGTRVDVQAWGRLVFTIGYGEIAVNGSDRNQWYVTNFNGTSSASACAAPAVALIQSFQLVQLPGTPLTPLEVRNLLIATGWPQGNPEVGEIGPAINIELALQTQFPAVSAPATVAAVPTALTVEPNPFRAFTTIRFDLARSSATDLVVLDVTGRRVRTLLQGAELSAGRQQQTWDGRDDSGQRAAAGVYFVRFSTTKESSATRLVRLQ